MPDTTPTTDRNGLAALLAHHADVLAARWRESSGRGAWVAASTLDSHAAELTADEETPFVRELLDSILAFEDDRAWQVLGTTDQQPPAPAEPCTEHPSCYTRTWERTAPTDRATEFELRADTEIRAAAFIEAADFVGNDDGCDCGGCDSCVSNKLAAGLRRMADEAQQPETEATSWPSTTEYTVEVQHTSDLWIDISSKNNTLTEAQSVRDSYRQRPHLTDARFRIVRWEETATVVETDPEPATEAHEHNRVTALDGDDRPALDEHGRPWTHCGICGQKTTPAPTEEQPR